MEKIQKKARVISINDELLADYNKENDAERVVLTFSYVEEKATNGDLQAFIEGLSHNNKYTVILDLSSMEGDNLRKKVRALQERIGDNTIICTTYIAKISELNDDGHTSVTSGDKTYGSFNRSYVGTYDDEKAALQALKDRLAKGIKENDYEWADD